MILQTVRMHYFRSYFLLFGKSFLIILTSCMISRNILLFFAYSMFPTIIILSFARDRATFICRSSDKNLYEPDVRVMLKITISRSFPWKALTEQSPRSWHSTVKSAVGTTLATAFMTAGRCW